MKYQIQKLDGRFSYNDQFSWLLEWPSTMNRDRGPLFFNHALQWCVRTWGWSAEIRQYYDLQKWIMMTTVHTLPLRLNKQSSPANLPPECNPNWSWSNGFDNLRIYLHGDSELMFFKLAHPSDQ